MKNVIIPLRKQRKSSAKTVDQNKVAIPRAIPAPPLPARRRVERACQECRERKIRCGGQKPACEQCTSCDVTCVYPSSYREKQEVQKNELKQQNEQLKSLLGKVADRVDSVAEEVNQTLGKTNQTKHKQISGSGRRGSSFSSSSAGSLDAIDIVDKDINRSEESRATGFVGKNSEISWLRSLDVETERINHPDQKLPQSLSSCTWCGNHIASKSYHTDDHPILELDKLNPYELPPKHVADAYYDAYLISVDTYLPIIRQSLFKAQLARYYADPFLKPGRKWLAILNMVFAITSRYCAMIGKVIQDGSEDVIFFTRAKMLSANGKIDYSHPDLQQVQIESLLAFYFLTLSQINRAWKMMRIASASAISLGINVRNVDGNIDSASKESRCRLWCSLLTLEYTLSSTTGRPSTLDRSFSVHSPLPFDESTFLKSPSSGFFNNELEREKIGAGLSSKMKHRLGCGLSDSMDLSLIANAICNEIYNVYTLQKGWSQVKKAIKFYAQSLDRWLTTIHDQFSFIDEDSELFMPVSSREQVGLALGFYSVCIILNRPCLSRPGFMGHSGIRFPRSRFGNDAAVVCIRSALSLLAVLPDEPSEDWFYKISPWWTTLHFIMQAVVILLIYLAVGDVPMRLKEGEEHSRPALTIGPLDPILFSCKKALCWLHYLGRRELSCKRGFEICHHIFYRIALSKELNLENIPLLSLLKEQHPNDPLRHLSHLSDQPPSASESKSSVNDNSSTAAQGLATNGELTELFPISLLEESDMGWFLSVADLDQSFYNLSDQPH